MRQGHLLSSGLIPSQDADRRGTDPGFFLLLLFFQMGPAPSSLTASVPKWSPLACLLKCWKDLDPIKLKKKKPIFLCTKAWPQYPLGDQEKWSSEDSLNYNTIL
jgi:hypothetical protein